MTEIIAICDHLGLGGCVTNPVLQTGGSLHEIWHVKTDLGEYSVKRINQKNLAMLGERLLPLSESIALAEKIGSPVGYIKALQEQDWLITPWANGQCVEPAACNEVHANKLGQLVKNTHNANYQIEARTPAWHRIDIEKWQQLIASAQRKKLDWSEQYHKVLPTISDWAEKINQHSTVFESNNIISHRDISYSNVVWTEGNEPILIDWEFAGLIHPELEHFIVMKNFGLMSGEKRDAFLNAAECELSLDDEVLTLGYLGYCLDWLEFNMERSLEYPEQRVHSDPQLIDYLQVLIPPTD